MNTRSFFNFRKYERAFIFCKEKNKSLAFKKNCWFIYVQDAKSRPHKGEDFKDHFFAFA